MATFEMGGGWHTAGLNGDLVRMKRFLVFGEEIFLHERQARLLIRLIMEGTRVVFSWTDQPQSSSRHGTRTKPEKACYLVMWRHYDLAHTQVSSMYLFKGVWGMATFSRGWRR